MLVPERVMACTWMPVERPMVTSKRLVITWNSAMASRLMPGWPNPDVLAFCVMSWPSRFKEKAASRATPGRRRDGVRRDALHHRGELLPVAAGDRQLLHLPAVDVAGDARLRDVDERGFARHGHRLGHGAQLERERNRGVLSDEQLDVRELDEGESCVLPPRSCTGPPKGPAGDIRPARWSHRTPCGQWPPMLRSPSRPAGEAWTRQTPCLPPSRPAPAPPMGPTARRR